MTTINSFNTKPHPWKEKQVHKEKALILFAQPKRNKKFSTDVAQTQNTRLFLKYCIQGSRYRWIFHQMKHHRTEETEEEQQEKIQQTVSTG